jgi:hypothetical protein
MAADLTTRIKNIQKQLGAPQSGIIDDATCSAFEKLMGIISDTGILKTRIKAIQKILKTNADGIVGPGTTTRMEAYLTDKLPKPPAGATMLVSRKGIDALIKFEISSKEYYNKQYQQPIWPGGHSGVTIGIGYDIGYATTKEFAAAWGPYVSASALAQLQTVCGKSGDGCKALLPALKTIKIPFDTAAIVFYQTTLPLYATRIKKIYPGIEKLPPDAQAALLSLVYNRGNSIQGASRKEMKNIAAHVASGNLAGIAKELRNMKRLWDPKKLKGLIDRREAEAVLVEKATFNILPEDVVMV